MSQQQTSIAPVVVAMIAAAVVVVLGLGYVNTQRQSDDDQVFVDIEADWTAGREVEVLWRVGPHSDTVPFGRDDRPRFGIRRVATRGWVVGVTVTPRDGDGTISCSIAINEELQVDDQVSGSDACEVDVTV